VERLNHVHITGPPGCESKARWFYGELLGLREIPKPAPLRERGGVLFQVANCESHGGIEDAVALVRVRRPMRLGVDDCDQDRVILVGHGCA